MQLSNIYLNNFKNHLESSFELIDGVNCFVGKNGIGKTNVLDAIHYLCLTKSYYNSSDILNINFDNDYFTLKGNFIKDEDDYELICSLSKNTNKVVKLNGKKDIKNFQIILESFLL